MAKGIPFGQIQPEPTVPTLMQDIVGTVMRLYAEGQQAELIAVNPTKYVDLVTQIGREVNFQELYGKVAFEYGGLFFRVLRRLEDGDWGERSFVIFTGEVPDASPREETLVQRIVRVWESCDQQCERGFQCPLLVEVGTDLNGEVTDACTSLRNVEQALGMNEQALTEAGDVFIMERAQGAQDDQEQGENQEDGLSGSTGTTGEPGSGLPEGQGQDERGH